MRPSSVTLDCSLPQASPSSKRPGKLRASLHGTYSWGIQSFATFRWRLSSVSTTSSSAKSSRASVQSEDGLARWGEVIVTGAPGGRGGNANTERGASGDASGDATYGIVGYVSVGYETVG